MLYSPLLVKAINVAACAHDGAIQKGSAQQTPYIAHVVAVGLTLQRGRYAEEVIAAGFLHDVLEDTPVTLEALQREFGERMAELVQAVSEPDKALSWEERKSRYRKHLHQEAPFEAVAISAADKLCNMHAILDELAGGDEVWAKFKRGREAQLENFRRLGEVIEQRLKAYDPSLVQEYQGALERLESAGVKKGVRW